MMVGDEAAVLKIRNEARDLAHKLDPENHGIIARPRCARYQLQRATAAEPGTIPKWGLTGRHIGHPASNLPTARICSASAIPISCHAVRLPIHFSLTALRST